MFQLAEQQPDRRQREVGRETVPARKVSRSITVIGLTAGTTSSAGPAGMRTTIGGRQLRQPLPDRLVQREPAVLDQAS